MDLFLNCKERFPTKDDLLRNMMGLLGNVAEVCTAKGTFFNYVDQFLTYFDPLPPIVDIC